MEISGNLLGGSNEDKEIMVDVSTNNILIGGPESKVKTGGHLEISGNLLGGSDEDKEIFLDVSSKNIKIGSGTSITKFNSSNSIVLPVGTTAEPTTNKGAVRYNNDRSRFEGCNGSKWISLEGVRDVDNNTYINAESAPEADENRLMFVTSGDNRMIIDPSGNLGLGVTVPKSIFNVGVDTYNDNNPHNTIPDVYGGNETTICALGGGGANNNYFGINIGTIHDGDTYIQSCHTNGTTFYDLLLQPKGGDVGIGTETPTESLDVSGNFKVSGVSTVIAKTTATPEIGTTSAHPFSLSANSIKGVTVDTTGKVGIATETPTESLDISGNLKVNSVSTVMTKPTATPEIGTTSAHPFSISANNIKAITVDTTGKVGLGTQTPEVPLHITKTTANGEYMRIVDPSNIGLTVSLDTSANDTKVNFGVRWWNNETPQNVNDGLVLRNVGGTNYVGIGTNVPDKKLDVVGDAIIRGDLTVSGTRTYVNTNNLDISDNVIVLNRGIGSSENTNVSSGILVKRHGNNQFMGWDDIQNSFILGETTEDGEADPSGVVLAGKSDLKIKDMNANDIVSTGTITGNNITGANTVLEILKVNGKTPITHNKTVTTNAGKFYIDGTIIPTLTFLRGDTYVFDQADTSNSTHPLKFSTTNDNSGSQEYTTGVTVSGTAGSAGATVTITVANDAPDTLYYYCGNHSNMGANITLTSPPIPAEIVDLSANKSTIRDLIVTNDLSGNKAKVVDLSATTIEASGDILLPNPSATDPQFSLMDLLGAPGAITTTDVSSTAVHIDLDINQIQRYHVGFTPDKLPMVTTLNLKLTYNDGSTVTTLLDKAVPGTMITAFEDLTKIRISKQAKQDSFSGGIYSCYGVTGLTSGQTYNLLLSFTNYHPQKNETTVTENLFVTVASAPNVQDTINITHPINNTQGTTSSTVYLVGSDPQFSINWTMPAANDGDVDKYTLEYEIDSTVTDNSTSGSNVEHQITIPGPYYSIPSNTLSLTLSEGVKFGAKYKFRVKARNDAGATAAYGNYNTANFYTVVPSLPPKSRIDNVSIKPTSWTSAQQYDTIDLDVFLGGTGGYYSSWNGSSFTDYDDTERKLLRQSYFVSNALDLLDISGINCSTTAGQKPTTGIQYIFTAKIWNGSNYQNESALTYSSLSNRSNGEVKSVTSGVSRLQVNLIDEHPNETASHKTGHWLKADITNIKFQLPNSVTYGKMAIQANVPGITSGFDYATVDFASDAMNSNPTISDLNGSSTWVGIESGAAVTWICGVASLNNGTKMVLKFKAANLASTVAGYYRGDYMQLEMTCPITNDIQVLGDDGTYGIAGSSTNSGNEIEYDGFTYNSFVIGGNTGAVAEDVTFSFTAYNIHGETTVTKTKKIIRDLASISSGLHPKRYKAWNGALAHNNVAGTAVAFDDTIALESHELLFIGGEITTTNADYKDYRVLYNQQINNNTITNTSLTNASWASNSTSYRYALYKLPNTVHFAGTGSFGIKFTTDGNGNAFTSGSGVESDFELNLLLPSMINNATPYWFNGNSYYQSESSKNTGTGSDGVTGLGIFDSKTRLNSYTTFKVTPPVPQTAAQQVNDIWIRVGFKANKNINISNIELVST